MVILWVPTSEHIYFHFIFIYLFMPSTSSTEEFYHLLVYLSDQELRNHPNLALLMYPTLIFQTLSFLKCTLMIKSLFSVICFQFKALVIPQLNFFGSTSQYFSHFILLQSHLYTCQIDISEYNVQSVTSLLHLEKKRKRKERFHVTVFCVICLEVFLAFKLL